MNTVPVFRDFNLNKQTILKPDFSNYVKDGIFSQNDNEKIFHAVVFYNKSFILVECNYHIYDKKLMIIIRCLEYWKPELESIEFLIQIFLDYQIFKYFMNDKKIPKKQIRYIDILSEYNFQVIFRPNKKM